MPEPKLTDAARQVLLAAREEAVRLGHPYVGTEHVLLGLAKRREAHARLWESLRLDPTRLEQEVAASTRRAETPTADPPHTARTRRLLEAAVQEAANEERTAAGPEHIVAALRRETRGITGRLLGAGEESGTRGKGGRDRSGGRSRREAAAEPERGRRPAPDSTPPRPRERAPRPTPHAAAPGGDTDGGTGWWRNILLVAVPASWILAYLGFSPTVVFVVSCLGVLPLAGYMGEATEQLAQRTGPTVGGVLNATFGNAAELIIAIAALRAGLIDLVKASIVGSILGNLLLILGLSLVAAGMRRPIFRFNRTAAGMSAAMMALAVVALVFPALYHAVHPEASRLTELHLSEAVAVILAVVYVLSLVFSLKTHERLFAGEPHPVVGGTWTMARAVGILVVATIGVAIQSEILVHAVEPMTASIGLSQFFVGLIVVPIIGNAAEHAAAVLVARKGQVDLALHIALGSSTQIALLVAPLLVLAGVLLGQGMNLVFTPFEIVAVGLSTVVVAILTLDGESHWFEGVQLLAVYGLVAVGAYFI